MFLVLNITSGGVSAPSVTVEGGSKDSSGRVWLSTDVRVTAMF